MDDFGSPCDDSEEDLIDPPTPYENFLYLMAELEQAVSRGTIKWPSESAENVLRRLGGLLARLQQEMSPSEQSGSRAEG
jgi:hypothetical protein